jgi:hypothetical protein
MANVTDFTHLTEDDYARFEKERKEIAEANMEWIDQLPRSWRRLVYYFDIVPVSVMARRRYDNEEAERELTRMLPTYAPRVNDRGRRRRRV